MTNPQTEARAIAEKIEALAHRWAMASYRKALSIPFEAFEPIRAEMRDIITTALAAKDAELAEAWQRYVDANEARIDAEAALAEARKALEDLREELACEIEERIRHLGDDMGDTGAARISDLRRAREAQGGENV